MGSGVGGHAWEIHEELALRRRGWKRVVATGEEILAGTHLLGQLELGTIFIICIFFS